MNIQEVSDILGVSRFLIAPQHIFITDERVCEGGQCYRGLQPEGRRDVIFLPSQADLTTPFHETWHANTGLGEFTAYPVGSMAALRYQILSKFPNLKQLLSKGVRYMPAPDDDNSFPEAKKYGDRVKHFIRVS